MVLNQVNVDNRLRYLIRGRVLVATTSTAIEYLEEDLRTSFPLYSPGQIQPGTWFVFLIEVNGYLTFDGDSDVKISKELTPFREFYFKPTESSQVFPADPYVPITGTVEGIYDRDSGNYHQIRVDYGATRFGGYTNDYFEFSPPQTPDNIGTWLENNPDAPRRGQPYRGPLGYRGFTKYNSSN